MGPGADHSRQADASRIEAAQARSEQAQAGPQAAGDAGRREHSAVLREALADLREREADQREREADQREAVADRREREADERAEQMQALIGEFRGLVTGAHRDALEAIEGSLALLSAEADSFQRSQEAAKRAAARRRREKAAIARAQDERQRAYSSPAGQGSASRARALRTRLSDTIAAFGVAEENTARIFDQLATSHPQQASTYQRKAQQARDSAVSAREVSRKLAD